MKKSIFFIICLLFLINHGFSQNDKIKLLIEKTNEMNLDMWDFTEYAMESIQDKNELAEFFYYWIGSNIQYDYELYNEIMNRTVTYKEFELKQDEYDVFENRKAVCAGYSNLYKWFMDEIDVEAVVISGVIRDERNPYINIQEDDDFRHAWNAIKLNDRWMLIDTTWGTSDDSSQSEFYFDIDPKWLISTHYPEDIKWQLLEEPLTLDEFNKSQFIKPVWYKSGFSDMPRLMADENYFYFAFKEPDSEWSVNLQYSADNIDFEHVPGIVPISQDGIMYYRFEKEEISDAVFFKVNLNKLVEEENGFSTWSYKDVINFKISSE